MRTQRQELLLKCIMNSMNFLLILDSLLTLVKESNVNLVITRNCCNLERREFHATPDFRPTYYKILFQPGLMTSWRDEDFLFKI